MTATGLPSRARVVIIGGGVNGASTAYHLAKRGCQDVVLLEKEKFLAAGSTGLSAGGIRQQYSTEVNVRMAMYSVRRFERFAEEMEADIGFHQVGYLFLLSTPEEVEDFQEALALQRRLSLEVDFLSPREARELVPSLNVDDIVGATFCPTDGYADPHAVTHGYAAQARRLGVEIFTETEVTGLRVEDGAVRAVQTTRGEIATPVVVNTGGPYAHLIGRMAGVELPPRPYRRQIFVTDAFPHIPRTTPMVIDFHYNWYFRPEGPGILTGMTDLDEPSSFNLNVSWDFMARVMEHGVKRVPILAEARVMRGWAGLYSVTPDEQPIVGRIPGVEGFICAVGFSGHGFMLGPATGLTLAEVILDGEARTFDIRDFRLERFMREEELVRETHVV